MNGRKVTTEVIDDQIGGANLTCAQDLVQDREVLMVVTTGVWRPCRTATC